MNKFLSLVFATLISASLMSQEESVEQEMTPFEAKVTIKHRTKDDTEKEFVFSNGMITENYLKDGVYSTARLYNIELDDDCKIAKLKITGLKNGAVTEIRNQSFTKTTATNKFLYTDNARMGPYMKPHGEDQVKIEMLVYRKNPEGGFMKVSPEESTFVINLDKTTMAETLAEVTPID